jgi:hypothetical protein
MGEMPSCANASLMPPPGCTIWSKQNKQPSFLTAQVCRSQVFELKAAFTGQDDRG